MGAYFILDGLEKLFGTFQLGPVSLHLEDKDYLVLLGTTGCGKTSLLRSIVGIRGKIKNRILLDGKDIGILPSQKRRIGYVAQASDLFPHFSVRKNVAFGLAYQNISTQDKQRRIERYLDLFNLVKQADQPVATLSGGENKRTAMARSLIVEPKILLLDEPLGMLDQNGREAMLETLKMIHDELQTTTIHVTHDRREAWRIAKQCAVMDHGRIIQTGTVAELVRTPKTRFVAEFLGGRNILQATFDGAHARLGWMDLFLPRPVTYSEGWVMIRPELIRINREKGGCKLSGLVKAIHDLGEYLEVDIAASNSLNPTQSLPIELKVHMPLSGDHQIVVGQQVFLDWRDESLHAFPMSLDSKEAGY